MANRWLSDLIGTAQNFFRIGYAGVRLKNNVGVLEVRNAGDSADANLKAALLQLSSGNPGAGKILQSDASGNGTWVNGTNNADLTNQQSFTQATASPTTIYTPQNGEIITKVIVEVTVAAGAGSPTLAIGVSGTTGAYMATTENNLKEVGVYEVEPMIANTAQAVIMTLVASAQTFSGTITIFSSLPG